ncbi:MAG: purine-nucleoside phosphorylase [Ruminococcus sp.]|uniref:purine-nucleoside phosphorylase n=1 Tax=Ruminococcus sp. TaxID=41978 RepID=UPI001B6DBE87|nr:purine-nucleoside phosphorylase [Ruminococcus sp.]MBP5579565.1 purine-nucleoside phosphorylase [Ruminococcus sp.]
MPTPHNNAQKGDIAKTVLMPGDPLRAKFIAENYLDDPVCYNEVRGMLGFTGKYKGVPVSVQGSGMGMPSIGIYSWELFNEYDVDNIIRVGTAGGVADNVGLRDVVIGMSASTNSAYASQYRLPGTYAPTASWKLLSSAVRAAEIKGSRFHVGNILSSDTFYDDADSLADWQKMGVLAIEMEAAALYMNAARAGKNALCILTVSDCPLKGLSTSAEERQTTFRDMMEIALEAAVSLE